MRRRFRLGATSFVYPAGWLENVRRLAGRVEDVELLFFESGASSLPDQAELAALQAAARAQSLSFTVHTPLDVSLASADDGRRRRSIDEVAEVIALSERLEPRLWVVHVYWGDAEQDPHRPPVEAWRQRARNSLEQVVAKTGVVPERIAVELLDYDFELLEPVLAELGLSAALDLGHLARDGVPWEPIWGRNAGRTRAIQWHGTEPGGRDHRSLRWVPEADRRALLAQLIDSGYDGVLTLEVFREADFEESLAIVNDTLRELEG